MTAEPVPTPAPVATPAPTPTPQPQPSGPIRPTVTVPPGDRPTTLVTQDITVGTGAEAVAGKVATVQYVGVAWSTGATFDATWDRNMPCLWLLGNGTVITGFEQGVTGMRVGGRRELIIPARSRVRAQLVPAHRPG
ncbi:FKBP-type peptidyl-prolyl cis-trans isomerase [Solirubrobacter ginsenosidimutans]|uniref:FKBP-type peptidyl-prolyl cis-trans isomerase n=1 Tax=Solirubrobacter ginsenosidimutans TaxID=490573 RepID=UPI0022CDBEC7|nr:FKBP-type peptidyl-prolyl cis-trans isomerase [Solirubrobacter ginsenosidimutans]